jgi:hypothetical protein
MMILNPPQGPGVPGAYEAQTANAEHEVLNEPTTVYLTLTAKLELWAAEILVEGKVVYRRPESTATNATATVSYALRVKAGGKWEVKVTKGVLAELHAVYQGGL